MSLRLIPAAAQEGQKISIFVFTTAYLVLERYTGLAPVQSTWKDDMLLLHQYRRPATRFLGLCGSEHIRLHINERWGYGIIPRKERPYSATSAAISSREHIAL